MIKCNCVKFSVCRVVDKAVKFHAYLTMSDLDCSTGSVEGLSSEMDLVEYIEKHCVHRETLRDIIDRDYVVKT